MELAVILYLTDISLAVPCCIISSVKISGEVTKNYKLIMLLIDVIVRLLKKSLEFRFTGKVLHTCFSYVVSL